jgi:hypothetical protein
MKSEFQISEREAGHVLIDQTILEKFLIGREKANDARRFDRLLDSVCRTRIHNIFELEPGLLARYFANTAHYSSSKIIWLMIK